MRLSAKLIVRIGYVEAGLRLFDCTMPQEISRILIDRVVAPALNRVNRSRRETHVVDKLYPSSGQLLHVPCT